MVINQVFDDNLTSGPPEISITATENDGNITYSCFVNSLIPVDIKWFHQDELINEIHARQDIIRNNITRQLPINNII